MNLILALYYIDAEADSNSLDKYNHSKSVRYTYSQASILGQKDSINYYYVHIQKVYRKLKKANIEYELIPLRCR